jgi:hypothetical protein
MKSPVGSVISRFAPLAVSGLLLSNCATQVDWPRRQALDSLVGRGDSEVIVALGPPSRSSRYGTTRYLAYDYRHTEFMPGAPGPQDPADIEDLWLKTPALVSEHCSTTFKLLDDKVVGWSFDGNGCTAASYPSLGALEQQVLVKLAPAGVAATTDFPADPNTGRSTVNYGVFQSK